MCYIITTVYYITVQHVILLKYDIETKKEKVNLILCLFAKITSPNYKGMLARYMLQWQKSQIKASECNRRKMFLSKTMERSYKYYGTLW